MNCPKLKLMWGRLHEKSCFLCASSYQVWKNISVCAWSARSASHTEINGPIRWGSGCCVFALEKPEMQDFYLYFFIICAVQQRSRQTDAENLLCWTDVSVTIVCVVFLFLFVLISCKNLFLYLVFNIFLKN